MAVDKLVDSSQLDTDLTSVANAIRAKSGGSSQLAFPAGFVSEIQGISEGGVNWDSIVNQVTISFAKAVFQTNNVVIDLGNLNVNASSFLNGAGSTVADTTVELKCNRILDTLATCLGHHSTAAYRKITTFIISSSNNPSIGSQFCQSATIQRVLGKPLVCPNFSTGSYKRFSSSNLVEVYFVPNKVTTGGEVATGVLVDASLVSLANALVGGLSTAQTIKITNATTKAKCDTIMGTVSQVTEDGVTYDFFTADAQGTVSLTSFITNTKGWTLA